MKMETKDYISLQKLYGGEYVAFYQGTVIAHAKTFEALQDVVFDKIGDENLIIEFVEPYEAVCVYRIPSS